MSQWYSYLIWPELLAAANDGERRDEYEAHQEEYFTQPEFPDENWAIWRAELTDTQMANLRREGCGALLTWAAWEIAPVDGAEWVSPHELLEAAEQLSAIVAGSGAEADTFLRGYEDVGVRKLPVRDLFLEDLAVVKKKARWALERGKELVSFDTSHSGSL